MAIIVFSFAGSAAYVAFDESEQIVGYDHDHLNKLLYLHDAIRQAEGTTDLACYGTPYTLFYALSILSTRVFGMNAVGLMAVPFLGSALILFFGFKLAKHLTGGSNAAGWLAASSLALTPVVVGLSRKYDHLTLLLGIFLASVLYAARLRKEPTMKRAVGLAAWLILGFFTAHDTTTLLIFGFFAAVAVGLVLLEGLIKRTVPLRVLVLTCFLFIFSAGFVIHFQNAFWITGRSVGYYADEWKRLETYYRNSGWRGVVNYGREMVVDTERFMTMFAASAEKNYSSDMDAFDREKGVPGTLPGYLLDMYYNSLRPIGTFLFLGLLVVFIIVNPSGASRLWALVPIVGIGALSFVSKKNPWYILEGLVLLPVFAGIAVAVISEKFPGKKSSLFVSLWLLALVALYVQCSLFSPPRQTEVLRRMIDRPHSVCQPVTLFSPGSYRERIKMFSARFDSIFPDRKDVRLGVVLDPGQGMNFVPYLLRASGKPIIFYLAALPDAPELGAGRDAVLFVPSESMSRITEILKKENDFYNTYFAAAVSRTQGHGYKGGPPSFQEAARRLALWKSGNAVELGPMLRLFLPAHSK